jgi:outer membrane protein OmpA-like peptidoglycan-associated protein
MMNRAKQILASSVVLMVTLYSGLVMGRESGGFKVSGYLGTGPDAKLVMIDGGRYEGVSSGDTFRIVRQSSGSRQAEHLAIQTGQVKVIAVYDHRSIAEVIEQSTPMSQEAFGALSEVMAGDVAMAPRLQIHQSLAMAPELNLRYSQIFDDDRSSPESFELSANGRDLLSEQAMRLAELKATTLMVIGHTDSRGSSEANQIESYQRAVVVRQYLIDQLGFDSQRVFAIGKGEDDLPEEPLTPSFRDGARRIVLKVVPSPHE